MLRSLAASSGDPSADRAAHPAFRLLVPFLAAFIPSSATRNCLLCHRMVLPAPLHMVAQVLSYCIGKAMACALGRLHLVAAADEEYIQLRINTCCPKKQKHGNK